MSQKSKIRKKDDFFKKIDSEEKAYILGFLMADGYVDKKNGIHLQLNKKDLEILQKINKIIHIDDYKLIELKNSYRMSISSESIHNDLTKIGCHNCKTKSLKFPKIEELFLRHFIRGYFDGDGCFTFSDKYNTVSVEILSTESFLIELDNILKTKLNIKTKIRKRKNADVFDIRIHKKEDVFKLLNWFYFEASIFMKRKFEKFVNFHEKYNKKIIKNKKREILQLDLNENIINEFCSINEAGRELKINPRIICGCCKGKIKSFSGYVFKYKT